MEEAVEVMFSGLLPELAGIWDTDTQIQTTVMIMIVMRTVTDVDDECAGGDCGLQLVVAVLHGPRGLDGQLIPELLHGRRVGQREHQVIGALGGVEVELQWAK